MAIQILREHKEMPWANGGGLTHEVIRFPETGDFAWRISMAEISSDGDFSILPDIDRKLILLEGSQIELSNQDLSIELSELEVFEFAGETPFSCALTTGPARDLNVMTRRGQFESKVDLHGAGEFGFAATENTQVFICLSNSLEINGAQLNKYEAAVTSDEALITASGKFTHIQLVNVTQ